MPVVVPQSWPAWIELLPFRAMYNAAWGALSLAPERAARVWVRVVSVGELRTLEYELRPATSKRSAPEGCGWLLGQVFHADNGRGLFSGPAGLAIEALRAVESRYLREQGEQA